MKLNKKLLPLIISVLAFFVTAGLEKAGIFHFLELKNYDARMNGTAKYRRPSDDLILIMLDQQSLDAAKEKYGWSVPWPREAWGKIYSYMDLGGAASVTYDILFSEPSIYGKEDDENFGRHFASGTHAKSYVAQHWNGEKDEKTLVSKPVEEIYSTATAFPNTTSLKDSDDIIRRVRISDTVQNEELVYMAFTPVFNDPDFYEHLPVIRYKNEDTDSVKLTFKGNIDRYARYNAIEILESIEAYENGEVPEYTPENFSGAHVFVIYYAPGLFDICASSVNKVYPGAGIAITGLDNYLTDSFMRTVPYGLNLLALFILCLLGTFITVLGSKSKKTRTIVTTNILLFAGTALLVWGINKWLFILRWDAWFVPLISGFIISFISSASVDYFMEGKQKRFIRSAFAQYLNPQVIDQMVEHPELLTLGGERRNISIFFSDIQSFTTLSEGLSPNELTALLNLYLNELSTIILESGGTIDKFEGDAIIAFWNAPHFIPDYSNTALKAALKCQERLKELEPLFIEKVGRPLWTRIGINSGDAVVGNMGCKNRFDYTMFGDSVNLASRLEGLNKQFGTYLLCTENTMKQAQDSNTDLVFRRIAKVQVVGKTEAVSVFEPMTKFTSEVRKEELELFEKGLKLFDEGKIKEALEIFESNKNDAPSLKYAEKCKEVIKTKAAESENWNGVWVATSK
ncbi:MAG: adenylate/guanylate cyclase domain-containing protein [Treponema sp.]|nr:adenylate/guanylate cyclase domain-containing protein [Treponema sp.]